MNPTSNPSGDPAAAPGPKVSSARPSSVVPIIDLSSIDTTKIVADRDVIAQFIPHRGTMMLVDGIVWQSADYTQGVGIKHVRGDEFWCQGHFPDRPLYPGVLQIESAAQLAAYLYYRRFPEIGLSVFCKIEEAVFRAMVRPGDELFLLCKDIRVSRKRFYCDVMGIVNGVVTFQATILGMALDTK